MNAPQIPQEDGSDPVYCRVESADVVEKKLSQNASENSLADSGATRFPSDTLPGFIDNAAVRNRTDDYREHLAAIVESSLDAIIGIDLNGDITSWNKGAETIFGFAAPEMVGNSITRLSPPDQKGETQHILGMLRRGDRVENFETTRQTKHGRLVDVSIAASPIRDAAGRIVGAAKIARDITVLKEREREIARISRLFAALSQVNQTIIWATAGDGLFQGVCRALVEHGGMNLAWIGWANPETHELVPVAQWGDDTGHLQRIKVFADDRPEGRGPSGLAFRSGQTCIVNDVINDPSTEPWHAELTRRGVGALAAFPIRSKTKVCAILSVHTRESNSFHDKEVALLEEAAIAVSFALDNFERAEARQQAEQTVRNEKLFSDTMIESMPGVLYFYDAKGRFLRWNRNFETVSGYSSEEIAHMHPLDFFSDTERARVGERIAAVLEHGESSVEASFVAKDGTSKPYFFTGKRIEFEEMTCLVGVGIDITARRKAETALRVLNDTLERRVAARTVDLQAATERAEAADRIKSAFLATMSHELRTPLNSIIGFTGIIIQGLAGPLNEEQSKQLGMVRTSARHLLALVNDVLDISKIEAGQLEVAHELFDVRRSVTKVIGLVAPLAKKKGLELRVEITPELGNADSDERRFEQVLLNLLSNAIKFTERGEVILTAELVTDFQSQHSGSNRSAVCLHVADTGMGIKPEDLTTLFQPFRQIDTGLARNHEGTGLGLAICRRLANLMGGEITVESVWGKGSTFSVTLPLKGPVHT